MTDRLNQLMKLYEKDPADAFLTYGIAMEYSQQSEHQLAIEWLDKTLNLDTTYCYAYFQKARSLSATGDSDQAKLTIQDGIEAARSIGDAHAQDELTSLLDELT